MTIEERLMREFEEHPREVMVIVGAGVTLGALHGTECQARASWAGLIRHGLEHAVGLGVLGRKESDALEQLLEFERPGMWISAAEQLSQALKAPHGGDFRGWLREAVEPFADAIADCSVLDVLADLQRRGATLATVNYDGVLEAVTGLKPVTWVDPPEVGRVLRGHAPGILHLHGYWERPESVVLGTTSYARVVADPQARKVLESMRMFKTLVFVGHGAGLCDPNWQSFLDWTAEIFAGSEQRHYRIVLESDMESLHDPDYQDRRIFPVPYAGSYTDLGPFLRTLVPATEAPASPASSSSTALAPERPSHDEEETEPAMRHVLLMVNIGNKEYHIASEAEIVKFAEIPEVASVHEVSRVIDLEHATEQDWRDIAGALDALLAKARQGALDSPEPVTFVFTGRAPIPVFEYLGYHSKWLNGRIMFVNQYEGQWDRIGPFAAASDFPRSTRTAFSKGKSWNTPGSCDKVAIFIGCSKAVHKCKDDAFLSLIEEQGHHQSALYRIEGNLNAKLSPLDQGDLAALTLLLTEIKGEISEQYQDTQGLVLAIAGPSWVAFWMARLLNTNVNNLIHFPDYPRGAGYRPALMSRMKKAPRIPLSKVLALAAEPDGHARINARKSHDVLVDAVEGGYGPEAKREIKRVDATRVSRLVRELQDEGESAHILHIYAHGSASGSLGFEDDDRRAVVVSAEQFVEVLRATDQRPALVVACACHSASLAPALLEVAEIVVAADRLLQYDTAIEFIGAFYRSLARGDSVKKAFVQGKVHAELQPGHDNSAFVLLTRRGIDPGDATFWTPRR